MRTLKNMFTLWFWSGLYYDFKWSIYNLYKYFNIVVKMRPWDSSYSLEMIKFQTKLMRDNMERSPIVDETKNEILEKMDRFIYLLDNILKDEYHDRCGYIPAKNMRFVETDDSKDKPKNQKVYRMECDREQTPEQIREIYEKSVILEQQEWDEMCDIMHNEFRKWWD